MLDLGVYTLAEVTQYTGVKPTTLRHWFMPRWDKKGLGPIFQPDYERVGDDFALSFLNLIEAYVASVFKAREIKPAYIRRVHEVLQERMGTPHPFAHEDLRTGGKRIILAMKDKRIVDALSKQLLFEHVEPHLKPILYDVTTNLAEAWRIGPGVVINPKIGFGKPVIENTGVSTLIVANQYLANKKNAALVARLFKLTESGVLNAFRFEHDLGRLAA